MGLDFHKVAESEDYEVYQSMKALKTKEMPNGEAPKKYTPAPVKTINAETVASLLEPFAGYTIDSLRISKNGGVVIRVERSKDNPYEPEEEGVVRLKGGGKK